MFFDKYCKEFARNYPQKHMLEVKGDELLRPYLSLVRDLTATYHCTWFKSRDSSGKDPVERA